MVSHLEQVEGGLSACTTCRTGRGSFRFFMEPCDEVLRVHIDDSCEVKKVSCPVGAMFAGHYVRHRRSWGRLG